MRLDHSGESGNGDSSLPPTNPATPTSRRAMRDRNATSGRYRVTIPDGRAPVLEEIDPDLAERMANDKRVDAVDTDAPTEIIPTIVNPANSPEETIKLQQEAARGKIDKLKWMAGLGYASIPPTSEEPENDGNNPKNGK